MHKKVILIPRPPSASTTELVTALEELGFDVIAAPLIAIENIQDIKLRTYEQVCEFEWIVCVSDKAVNSWVDAMNNIRPSDTSDTITAAFNKSLPLKGLPPIWVPGATTAACVKKHGGVERFPKNGVGSPAIYADMLEEFVGDASKFRDEKILLVCGEGGGQEFDQLLGRATPKEIVYRTRACTAGISKILNSRLYSHENIDYVWVTSGSILKALEYLANYPGPSHVAYGHTQIIAGSQRLGSLAKDFKDKKAPKANTSFQGNVITLPEPTNQQLLRYLEAANKAANPTAKAPGKTMHKQQSQNA